MTDIGILQGFFVNYETVKLHIAHPLFLNSLIYFSLLLAILLTLKKNQSSFLDFSQTEQLKGLAIFFVIVEHFWYHVCGEKGTVLVLGDYAVTLFLLLSGYGLMSSNIACQVTARIFLVKRMRKILLPYWVVTLGIIIADYVLLEKQYPFHEILLTCAGINVTKTLQYFDHARWFITLLLINYFAFFFCARLLRPRYATAALFFLSIVLILLRRYEFFPLGARHQLIAFPLGCLLAVLGPIKWWGNVSTRNQISIITLVILAMLSIYLGGLKHTDNYYMEKFFIHMGAYIQPYLFCFLCIVSISFLAFTGYVSRFLNLCGFLSYELYLIHGPLLVKYNPTVGYFENRFIVLGIFLWLAMTMGFAFVLKVGTSPIANTFTSPPNSRLS